MTVSAQPRDQHSIAPSRAAEPNGEGPLSSPLSCLSEGKEKQQRWLDRARHLPKSHGIVTPFVSAFQGALPAPLLRDSLC